jgi:HAD superfamily hydrolase (TIGR01509 family)
VIRAVVFDFDGLVLDTETPIYRAWSEVFEAHGTTPPPIEVWAAEVGSHGVVDFVALLHERATVPVDIAAVDATRRSRHEELIAAEAILPGVVDWLDAADQRGFGIAIASSSTYDWVHTNLDRLGIRHRFAHVSCRDEQVPAKPAPDVYLRACTALRVAPAEAIAIEDSPNGIAAAKAAGLWCVAVPNPITAPLDFSAADIVVRSLTDCPLDAAIARLA